MPYLSDNLTGFSKDNFLKLIKRFVPEFDPTLPIKKNYPVLNYVYNYLKDLRAHFILIEEEYIDKDYIIDFSSFYARSFPPYKKSCSRLHFFSGKDLNRKIDDLVKHPNEKELKAILTDYLGFTVIKPLPGRFFGRTILKTYPKVAKEKNTMRHFPNLVKYNVAPFGVPLKISSVAYQEQDKVVSACATVAIWVTLHKLKELFNAPLLSPSEITLDCGKEFPFLGRIFPAEGLNSFQIISFLNKYGFETEYIDMEDKHIESILSDNNKTKILLFSYLKYGLPIIAGTKMKSPDNPTGDHHVIVILGYNSYIREKEEKLLEELQRKGYFYESDFIEEFYVHDDQIGPFSRCEFKEENCSLKNEWLENGYDKILLDELFIPVYHKIRLSFFTVYRYSEKILKPSFIERARAENSWFSASIYLTDVNQYKKEILENVSLKTEKKLMILKENMPKYLWIIKICKENERAFDFIFDTTDMREMPMLAIRF